jgi:PelA/Pel-15E family pectate lyase
VISRSAEGSPSKRADSYLVGPRRRHMIEVEKKRLWGASLFGIKMNGMHVILLTLMLTGIVWGADVTVALDGSGDVRSVNEAVARVPENNTRRFIIRIKPGVYEEQIRIPASKPFVSFIGSAAERTILRFRISNKDAGSTSAAYATYIGGHDFRAERITFENSFGPGSQAVAALVEADRSVFKDCRFIGWQDTLYAKNGRQYYDNSYIEGHVDYIFGQAAAVFNDCTIHSKGDGYIAAPMRFAPDEPSGFVFIDSKLTSTDTQKGVYLGRPWRDYGRTIFLNTKMDAAIRPEGWHHWEPKREATAYMGEYASRGRGARMSERVKWAKQLSEAEAANFRPEVFLKGKDGWDPRRSKDAWLQQNGPDWDPVKWADVFRQKPEWYQTDEAARIADQVILYQKDNGGWEKNVDMTTMLTQKEREAIAAKRGDVRETTIDNRTTYPQVAYLARVITASLLKASPPANLPRYREAFNKGLDYLLASQYENGGFPQFYPLKKGYYSHITFNDDAMIGVLKVLREVGKRNQYYLFVDTDRQKKAEQAVAKAIPLILKTQVVVNGKKTVWAAQYDEVSLKPAAARAFEPVSLSAGESVGIVRFLMLDSKPSPEVADAIESAVRWFEQNKVNGLRWERKDGQNQAVADKNAPPIWARFYEINSMRPIFIGRDGVVKYDVMQIEAERRNGYAWYVDGPGDLLREDYPKWKTKVAGK